MTVKVKKRRDAIFIINLNICFKKTSYINQKIQNMGLWDKLKNELIDIVEHLDSSDNTLSFRFERRDNEIKNGAKLTVRPGQLAVFVNEGQYADVFKEG